MNALPTTAPTQFVCRIIAALLVAFAAAWAPSAAAQAFKTDEVKLTTSEAGQLNSDFVGKVRANVADFQNAESRRQFESYFTDFLFPLITQTSADGLRDISRRRSEILRALQPPINDQAFQRLTSMTLEEMKRIATENYHPMVRYNAMLILGSLDAAPGSAGNANEPAPLPEASDFLLQMLQANPSEAPDVVKLAAVVGLERHAASLPPEKQKTLTDALLDVISSQRPNYRTPESHAWLQFRAVEAVTQLGDLGENNRIHDAIIAMMSDDNIPLTERMYAAKSLERLTDKYTADAGIDAEATLAALGNVLADVMTEEKDEAFKFLQPFVGGFGGFQPGIGLGGAQEEPTYGKGRFLQRVNYVLDGFQAVEGALPDDLKQEVQSVVAQVATLREAALDRSPTAVEVTLPRMIDESADDIVDAAEDLGQAPGAAATPDDDGLGVFGAQP